MLLFLEWIRHFRWSSANPVTLSCVMTCFPSSVSFHASSPSKHVIINVNCVTSCARAGKHFTFTALYWQSIIARYSCAFPRHLSVNRTTQVGWIRAPAFAPINTAGCANEVCNSIRAASCLLCAFLIDVDKRVRLQNSIACNQTGCAFSECTQEFTGLRTPTERAMLVDRVKLVPSTEPCVMWPM